MTDVFKQMQDAAREADRQDQQFGWQERIVKQLMRRANIAAPIGALKREALEQRNSDDLGFAWFNEQFPRFPLILLAQKMKYTQTAMIGDLYGKGRFKKLPWWKEYEEQTAANDINLQTTRAALLFNLPYARDAFLMVLHNQPTQEQVIRDAEVRQDEPWPRTTFPIGNTGVVAVLEAFDSFMQTVGTEWADT